MLAYRPGSVQEDRWFGPVTRPRLTQRRDPVPRRGRISADITGVGDGGSAHSGDASQCADDLVVPGRPLELPNGRPHVGVSDLAPQRLPYRLVVDTDGRPAVGPYSSTTHTEWRFTSGAPPDGRRPIPLAQLDYGTDLDLQGRAKRRTDIAITPAVLGSDLRPGRGLLGPARRLLRRRADLAAQKLKEKKGTWQASLNAPPAAGTSSSGSPPSSATAAASPRPSSRAFGLEVTPTRGRCTAPTATSSGLTEDHAGTRKPASGEPETGFLFRSGDRI